VPLLLSEKFLKEVNLLHKDTQSGAAQIADKSLVIMQKECILAGDGLNLKILKKATQLLLDTHPMASLENALFPICVQLKQNIKNREIMNDNFPQLINSVFKSHRDQLKIFEERTIETLYNHIKTKKSILTFSYSDTIISTMNKLSENGYCDKEIYILESRPLKEGEKTAILLSEIGFSKIHLGIDFAVKKFVDKSDLALLGADTIYPDGRILNKIGSINLI
jgi:translation initiation factor 2B subunit (eIF-2B alpha/beta/delta family)